MTSARTTAPTRHDEVAALLAQALLALALRDRTKGNGGGR